MTAPTDTECALAWLRDLVAADANDPDEPTDHGHARYLLDEVDRLTAQADADVERIAAVVEERDRLRAEVALLRDALGPFADAALPRVLDPHPCTELCWRVGGPTDTTSGVCVECGRRARADEERSGWTSTEGALRAAVAALAATETKP